VGTCGLALAKVATLPLKYLLMAGSEPSHTTASHQDRTLKKQLRGALKAPQPSRAIQKLLVDGGSTSLRPLDDICGVLGAKSDKDNRVKAWAEICQQIEDNDYSLLRSCLKKEVTLITCLAGNISLPKDLIRQSKDEYFTEVLDRSDFSDPHKREHFISSIWDFNDVIQNMKVILDKESRSTEKYKNSLVLRFILKRLHGKKYDEISDELKINPQTLRQSVAGRKSNHGRSGDKYFVLALIRCRKSPHIQYKNAISFFKKKGVIHRKASDFYTLIKWSSDAAIKNSLYVNTDLSEGFLRRLMFHGHADIRRWVSNPRNFSGDTQKRVQNLHNVAINAGATQCLQELKTNNQGRISSPINNTPSEEHLQGLLESGVWGAEIAARHMNASTDILEMLLDEDTWTRLPGPFPSDDTPSQIQDLARSHPNWNHA
jgi:hypothetical protein